jgi:hypothetical protein
MEEGLIGCMTTPMQGNRLPDGVPIGVDNGKFGEGWVGYEAWLAFVEETIAQYGADRILWVTAPDAPFNAEKTLIESLPWLPKIRKLGVPAAFVAQNGAEKGLVPFGDSDVLFLGGGPECVRCDFVRPPKAFGVKHCPHCHRRLTEWKTSPAARRLALEAHERGVDLHMGRSNSAERLITADEFGCKWADGTFPVYAPRINLERIRGWYVALEIARALRRTQPSLFDQEVA